MFQKLINKYGSIKVDLFLFIIIHFLVWSIIPIFRETLPMDTIEAIIWGQNGGWLTNKHPPLSGYVANTFYQIFFHQNISMYILSQVFVAIGFIYIYKLARLFISERRSVLSVLLLEGIIYYGFTSTEFNVNIISLALWPMTAYYFYISINNNKIKDWIILGVLVGVNILNKYSCVNLFFGMFIYLCVSRETRKQFLNKNLYICGIIALLCILPHLYWLYKTDFIVFNYFKSRTVINPKLGLLANIIYPTKFIFAQFIAGLVAIIMFSVAYIKSKKDTIFVENDDKLFMFCLGVLPLFATALPSLISGVKLKSMWGTPCLYMLTIMLFSFLHFEMKENTYKRLKCSVYFVMTIFAISNMVMTITTKSIRYYFPKDTFVENMTNYWKNETSNEKLKYVMGDIWYTSHMSLYQNDKPHVIYNIDAKYKNILNESELAKHGVMILGTNVNEVQYFQDILSVHDKIKEYSFKTKNLFGKGKKYTLYYSIIKPTIIIK